VNGVLILRCDASDRSFSTDLLQQTTQLFQDHRRKLEETEYEVETAVHSRFFAEFIGAVEGRRPETNMRNIDGFRTLCSEFSFEELLAALAALEAFDAPLLHAGVSWIEGESDSRVHDVEEKNQQLECDVGFLQQEVSDLGQVHSGDATENKAQKQENDALRKRHDELVAWFALAHSISKDAIRGILQEFEASRKQNHTPSLQKQFLFNNRGETAAGRDIWQLMAKSGQANKSILQESLRRRSSAATVVIWKFLGLSSVRSMRSAWDSVVFFRSIAKDSDATKQKVMVI
jgi:regulator of replication initiation timing